MQRRYVDEIIVSEKSKVQQYLKIRPVVELNSYAPAAYLQAVGPHGGPSPWGLEPAPRSGAIMHWFKLVGSGRADIKSWGGFLY